MTGFPDYCISGKGIIVCTKNNPLHYSGEVIDYTKKCSVKLYTSITNEIIDVDLVWLLAVQFIGFDTTGTMRPELNSPDGTIKIEYVTYHWNNLKQLDADHIDIDGIIYTRFDKSIYTYLSKDGIAFNLRRKEFQRATMEPKGYSMIGYNKRFRKAGEKATGAVRSHLAMWDIYHPEDPPEELMLMKMAMNIKIRLIILMVTNLEINLITSVRLQGLRIFAHPKISKVFVKILVGLMKMQN